jgi:quinol monooxygenase YgiN
MGAGEPSTIGLIWEMPVYVVTVEFEAKPEHRDTFREAMVANARASREREHGCRQFDVTEDAGGSESIFLYEVYDDRAAFDVHTASAHFLKFDARVRDWVARKVVRIFHRIDP